MTVPEPMCGKRHTVFVEMRLPEFRAADFKDQQGKIHIAESKSLGARSLSRIYSQVVGFLG